MLAWIERGPRGGRRRSLTGGELEGELLRPTVVERPPADAQLSCDEAFGPVCTLQPYDTLDEAIELANATRYGLQAGIFTSTSAPRSRRRAARVRRRDRERGADLPRRPDAVRRRQGLGQHARRPGLGGSRDDRGAAGRAPALGGARGRAEPRAYHRRVALFYRKPPAPAASDLRRERRALLLLREERLRDLGGLTLEMYRRDQFNEALVVERCAELVAIETRVSRDRRAGQGRRAAAQAEDALLLRRAGPDRRPLLPELRALARRDRAARRGHARVSAAGGERARAAAPPSTAPRSSASGAGCGSRAPSGSARCRPRRGRSGSASAGSRLSRAPAQPRRSRSPGKARRPSVCVTATGGSVTAPHRRSSRLAARRLAPGQRGWTIVLVSIPKAEGRDEAVAVAQQARTRGLAACRRARLFALREPPARLLDEFTGRFQSEADATGSLRRARVAVKGARVVARSSPERTRRYRLEPSFSIGQRL